VQYTTTQVLVYYSGCIKPDSHSEGSAATRAITRQNRQLSLTYQSSRRRWPSSCLMSVASCTVSRTPRYSPSPDLLVCQLSHIQVNELFRTVLCADWLLRWFSDRIFRGDVLAQGCAGLPRLRQVLYH